MIPHDALPAVWLSLKVALVATALALPAGVALAWVLARRSFPGRQVVELLLTLPLVLPPVVTGYFLLVVFGAQGGLGRWLTEWGIPIAFTWRGAAIASAVLGFPLMVRTIQVAFEAVDPGLEEAARTLGASKTRVFRTITLPLARSGIAAGAVLAFARSLGEFGATITFAGNIPGETRTIPLAIYSWLSRPGGETGVLVFSALSVALALVALTIGVVLAKRTWWTSVRRTR